MSRLPPELARRLDGLSRRAHAFHRFAHHPLCEAYAGEVVRLGRRTALCRGCALALLGGAAGAVAALALPLPPAPAILAALLLAAAPALAAPRRPPRPGKLVTRALPAALAAAAAVLGARAGTLAGAAVAAAAPALLLVGVAAYRRRAPDRSPCAGCAELHGPRTCRGLRPMARREAAFARLAGRLLRAAPHSSPGS